MCSEPTMFGTYCVAKMHTQPVSKKKKTATAAVAATFIAQWFGEKAFNIWGGFEIPSMISI